MSPKPRIISTSPEKWSKSTTTVITSAVKSHITAKGTCSMMLTGGNTAKRLYQHWAISKPWDHKKVNYFFGDELCVPSDHEESNYSMVIHYLFQKVIPNGCNFVRMEGEVLDRETAARRYEKLISKSPDMLLLSVGPDGHIASLFPGSATLQENTKSVVPVVVPKPLLSV